MDKEKQQSKSVRGKQREYLKERWTYHEELVKMHEVVKWEEL